ncbi:hypothetical protein DPMN_014179 [Dreissena polymorpha]|uniref:Uncharacterized protein n=1 Tax=Dreissena polymorpha TaxID=45954 RepID=A0A9D4N8X3_DREPO|nr:hypothetical protein DPMN_014179 [Dreissena polymorpha]
MFQKSVTDRLKDRAQTISPLRNGNIGSQKNAASHCGLAFQPTKAIFELTQDIITKNNMHLTFKVFARIIPPPIDHGFYFGHIWENSPSPGGHDFIPNGTIFKLVKDTIRMNRFSKNPLPPGGHVYQLTETFFKLVHDIFETNLVTKFHEDRTTDMANRVLTRQLLMPHARKKAIRKAHHEHNVLRLANDYLSTNI